MIWLITFVIGLVGGAAVTIGALWNKVETARRHQMEADAARSDARRIRQEALSLQQAVQKQETELKIAESAAKQRLSDEASTRLGQVERRQKDLDASEAKMHEIAAQREAALSVRIADFHRRVVSYEEITHENLILKRDLQNIDVNLNKRLMDNELLHQQQVVLDGRSTALATRYLAEVAKWVSATLTPNNFATAKDRLTDIFARVREIGFNIPASEEQRRLDELKAQFERVVRIAIQREEQARIKAQIREEERLQREAERAIEQSKRESDLIQAALDRAMTAARGEHNDEVERLKLQLAEAEAKSVRALSMAQQTRAGNIYVISNRGSFGDGVFKIGMTRRLEPMDRVRELGDASVPFPFDVHMMIACTDAPALENALHRALHHDRINKVNPRKEFFRVNFETILRVVKENHGEVAYVADAEALQYSESLTMSDEDSDYIEAVFGAAEKSAVIED